MLNGIISSVTTRSLGASLAAPAVLGDTTLTLDQVVDFADEGGQVQVIGPSETPQLLTYTAVDRDTGVLTLSGALGTALDDETFVAVYPLGSRQLASVIVDEESAPSDVDTIEALVPFVMRAMLPDGIREDPETAESVILDIVADEWQIIDLRNQPPRIEREALVVVDGEDPPTPSGLTATAGPGLITVAWNGTFEDGEQAPDDYSHVAIHIAEKSLVDGLSVVFPSSFTHAASIMTLEGGQVTLARTPDVAYYVGLVAVTLAGKWSPISDVVTVTPSPVVATGANGQPVFWGTEAEMLAAAYPWTEGSTWFNTEASNAPNVWRGGAWAPATFGDGAIAALNVAKLVGDTITGNYLIAGRFETAVVGGVKMDSAGLRVHDTLNVLKTALNSDGTSIFRGQVEASGVEVLGKLKFHGSDSEVAAGARLNITGGVTAPTTSPNVYAEWPTVTLSGVPKTYITGVTRDPANGDWIVASMNSTGAPTATRHAAATGAKTATLGTFPTPTGYQYPANGGVAFVDGVAWVPQFINEYESFTYYTTTRIVSTAGTVKTILAKSASFAWSEGERMSIGTASATQVAVSLYDFTRSADKGRLLLYTPSTSTASGNVACADVGLRCDPVAYGSFDFGAARFVLDTTDTVKTYLATGAAEADNNFRTGRSVQSVGVGWYGGAFWTAGTDGKCYTYDGPNVGAVGAEFAATWYDSKSAGTGVHETPLGPSGWSETGISRARLRVHPPLLTLTDGDDGVDSVRIYARVGSDMRLQGTLSAAGATLLITGALATGGAIHGAVADFPATSPGFIENSTGDIVLPGNGMARLRGLNLPVSLTSETITNLPHGLYLPGDTGLITTARGYPVAGVAGVLEVIGYVTGSGLVHRYTTREAALRVFTRSSRAGTWSPWVQTGGALVAPMLRATITTDVAKASGTSTITGWTEVLDTAGAFNPSTGIYTVPTDGDGLYTIAFNVTFATQSTRRMLQLEAGGSIVGRAEGPASGYSSLQIVVDCLPLTAGQTILPRAYTAAAATIKGSDAPASFSVRYLGPTP